MNWNSLSGCSCPARTFPPTHQMVRAMPMAAITSMSGDEKARSLAMPISSLMRMRLAFRNRACSYFSIPKACTTRIPLSVSSAISAILLRLTAD